MKAHHIGLAAIAGAVLLTAAAPGQAENIGMAREEQPNARSQALTHIFRTLIGTSRGRYTYFDERLGKYVTGPTTMVFGTTQMPNVLTLYVETPREGLPPIKVFNTMVMQANGASWRQMAFTDVGGRIQDKIITGYTYTDDRNWTVDMLEVQQGLGAASAVTVSMVTKNGHVDMRKFRKFEGGPPTARPYESLAEYDIGK